MDRRLQRHVGHRPHRRCICRGPRNRGARARALCWKADSHWPRLPCGLRLGRPGLRDAMDTGGWSLDWHQVHGGLAKPGTGLRRRVARNLRCLQQGARPRLLLGGRGDYWQLRSAAPRRGTSTLASTCRPVCGPTRPLPVPARRLRQCGLLWRDHVDAASPSAFADGPAAGRAGAHVATLRVSIVPASGRPPLTDRGGHRSRRGRGRGRRR